VVENRRNSEQQGSRLETQLQTLGAQIQELRLETDPSDKAAKLKEVDEKYQALAEEFFRSMPLRTAQERFRTAQQQVEEVQRMQALEVYLRAIKSEIEKLAAAYNRSAEQPVLEIQADITVQNRFDPNNKSNLYILLKFQGPRFWAIRDVSYPDRTIALQFVRLLSPDGSSNYEAMQLTDDSINLVLFEDKFGVSLNQSISQAVKANVTDDLSAATQPLDKLGPFATELARRIIEYELLSLNAGR
jgi:hypothetical protein